MSRKPSVADFMKPSAKVLREHRKWLAARPPAIRELAERFPPWSLFRLKSTGHRVHVIAYGENGTLRVAVTGRFNALAFERQVFGVDPNDMEPCELPGPDEPLGVLGEISDFITRDPGPFN